MDKPEGPTSHDVVARVRRLLGTRAVGHTGTLDPFATGLLVLLIGRATRVARFVEACEKTYLAVARLGLATTTDDRTGVPLAEPADVSGLDAATVRAALTEVGRSGRQRPPAYSAKRVAGERSYRLARRGQSVELADLPVRVRHLELVEWQSPVATFRATVSAGTYLRALARDLGTALGVGAHLTALRREAIGALRVDEAVALDHLTPGTQLVPLTRVLAHLPIIEVDDLARAAIRHGRAVAVDGEVAERAGGASHVTLVAGGDVVGVGRVEGDRLKPSVVLESP